MEPQTSPGADNPPPSADSLAPRSPARRRESKKWILQLALAAIGVFFVIGIVAVILSPAGGDTREMAARRGAESSLRKIMQASLVYAIQHDGEFPETRLGVTGRGDDDLLPATVQMVAAALARGDQPNDATIWFAMGDHGAPGGFEKAQAIGRIVDENGILTSEFLMLDGLAWDFVTGLTQNMAAHTPMAWTRGLRRDGHWDADTGVFGKKGGFVLYLDGEVAWVENLSRSAVKTRAGEDTADILKALPEGTRVVGSGPGTLDGSEGGR